MAGRKSGNLDASAVDHIIGSNQDRLGLISDHSRESRLDLTDVTNVHDVEFNAEGGCGSGDVFNHRLADRSYLDCAASSSDGLLEQARVEVPATCRRVRSKGNSRRSHCLPAGPDWPRVLT